MKSLALIAVIASFAFVASQPKNSPTNPSVKLEIEDTDNNFLDDFLALSSRKLRPYGDECDS